VRILGPVDAARVATLQHADAIYLEEIRAAEQGGGDWIHVDVMDGRFVPEISMGPIVVEAVRRATRLPIDVHLMIAEPDRQLEAFARAGATHLVVHVEACPHLYLTLQRIASLGMGPSVALNPATPPDQLEYVLPLVQAVLVMTVEPGLGGQSFIPEMLRKVRALAARRAALGLSFDIEVDGGIRPDTAGTVVEAGATVLVAGTAVFGAPDGEAAAIARLRAAARAATQA
jgi:ribulose-phosphate 3-epimerase